MCDVTIKSKFDSARTNFYYEIEKYEQSFDVNALSSKEYLRFSYFIFATTLKIFILMGIYIYQWNIDIPEK